MLAAFYQIQTDSQPINQLQDSIQRSLKPLFKNPLVDGVVVTNVVLTTGQVNAVNHKLGRDLVGWIVIRQRAQAQIWDTQDSNRSPDLNLLLNTSANVTVDLYCF